MQIELHVMRNCQRITKLVTHQLAWIQINMLMCATNRVYFFNDQSHVLHLNFEAQRSQVSRFSFRLQAFDSLKFSEQDK